MASYIITNKAVTDLTEIWNYTFEKWSEKQADNYFFMIVDTFQNIADGKVKGKLYSEINQEIFGYRIGQHIIFYRELNFKEFEITRILHVKMDLKNRMQEDPKT